MTGASNLQPGHCAVAAHCRGTSLPLLTSRVRSLVSAACACGNYYEVGYAWMAVILILCSCLLVREFATLPPSLIKRLLILGALCAMTPGVLPEHFERRDRTKPLRFFDLAYELHMLGLGAGTMLLTALPFAIVCIHSIRRLRSPARWRVLGWRAVHALGLLGFGIAFLVLRGTADVSDYCAAIAPAPSSSEAAGAAAAALAEAECASWPALPAAACASVGALESTGGHPVPARYSCGWVNGSLSHFDELMLPASYTRLHASRCLKTRCRLLENALSMSLEFGMLFLVGSYVAIYTRTDMEWVLEWVLEREGVLPALVQADEPLAGGSSVAPRAEHLLATSDALAHSRRSER